MLKKRFKQYTILKYKKRIENASISYTNGAHSSEAPLFAPNRVTNLLLGSLGGSLKVSGVNRYALSGGYPECSFKILKSTILYGPWLRAVNASVLRPLALRRLFPPIALIRVLGFLAKRLAMLLSVSRA